jgi:hypothetical protein
VKLKPTPHPHRCPVPPLVGKTAELAIGIRLAEKMNGEIVSASDSRLFYRGMDIGTAKPSREEMARVPHHLIDIVNPDETLSLAVFQQKQRDYRGHSRAKEIAVPRRRHGTIHPRGDAGMESARGERRMKG